MAEDLSSKTAKQAPPDGVKPIWIQAKNYATYGLGSLETGYPSHVLLKRADLLTDIDKYGFMNDFNDYKVDLKKYKGEDVLLVHDEKRTYGEDWYFCFTQEAYDAQWQQLTAAAAAAGVAAEAAAAAEADAKLKAEEEARPVYVDKPILPRPWASTTSE
ncbi:hypothetical protein JKP88DRAFT_287772 [Tribonema minus]|uniref:Uncharacterized protein n=1 Tax=Tribonema minus TaxID=303371 RepID=A0A836CJ73_9STRA|nr:hypothetical protein JKP88DRAFT_287772 [Tribonema minus]